MSEQLKRLVWKLHVALMTWDLFYWNPVECWNFAEAIAENSYGDFSPRDAFNSELSHWEF